MAVPSLRIVSGAAVGSELSVDDELRIGRAAVGPGALGDDPELSREHAVIRRSADGALLLEDLGSTNGTFLNGWRVPAPQILRAGDRIQLGQTVLEVVGADPSASAAGVRRPAVVSRVHGQPAPAPEPEPHAVLYASGIEKSYGELSVLRGLDLEVAPGEIVGLLGPNGAGKTTFVSIVAGLRRADAGTVSVAGIDVGRNPHAVRRNLGLAPQDLGIYPIMTVRRNLTFFGELGGLRGSELERRVTEVADALSLSPKLDSPAGTMSGGQQRRLHTGMAMMHKPPLLIFDEPTVGADIRTREEILELVRRLADDGHGVVYSTHYLPEIEALGASVAILEGGQVIARGSIAELVANHSTTGVELHFEGPAPDLAPIPGAAVTRVSDTLLRIESNQPAEMAATALRSLGEHAQRLRKVDVIQPSLDAVYLTLTEDHYSGAREVPDEVPLPPLAAPAAAAPRGAH